MRPAFETLLAGVNAMTRRNCSLLGLIMLFALSLLACLQADGLIDDKKVPTIQSVGAQPLLAQVNRLVVALDSIGDPLASTYTDSLKALKPEQGDAAIPLLPA